MPAQRFYRFIIRYKLYHIPFWFLYHYAWWSITVGNPMYVAGAVFNSAYGIKNAFYIIFQALGVYFNLYFLMPRLLEKGKYVLYVTLVLLVILIVAVCIVPGYYISAALSDETFKSLYGVDPADYFHFFQLNTLPSSVASMTLAMSVKLAKNYLQSRAREKELHAQQVASELQLLKNQLHPHFLFNTMNSIYFLIDKNPVEARAALAQFSDMLRHQLYESADTFVSLSKEIQYINSFIQLEKLRHNDNMQVRVKWPDEMEGLVIAPFMLMTFVENAFKHVSREAGRCHVIDMKLCATQKQLDFTIFNSISPLNGRAAGDSGIGLHNVRRRLELLYHGKYTLTIQPTENHYTVQLELKTITT